MSTKRLFVFDRYRLDERSASFCSVPRSSHFLRRCSITGRACSERGSFASEAGSARSGLSALLWKKQPDPWYFVAATGARFDCRWKGLYSNGIEARISFHLTGSRDNRDELMAHDWASAATVAACDRCC